MRKFLASIIVLFASCVTCALGRDRRAFVKAMVLDRMSVAIPVTTRRGQILLHAASRPTCRQARLLLHDEPETIEWIESINDGGCFWDIGANIGIYSLYAALNGNIRVLSFEPAGSNYNQLNRNIELNSLEKNVSGYCCAFSKETTLDVLNISDPTPGRSMHGFGTEIDQFGNAVRTTFRQGAVGFSIDDFVSLFSPPLPTHVKIDVDGIEADILRGGRETLSAPSVKSVIVEVQGDLCLARNPEIMALMEELGFKGEAEDGIRSPKHCIRQAGFAMTRPRACEVSVGVLKVCGRCSPSMKGQVGTPAGQSKGGHWRERANGTPEYGRLGHGLSRSIWG